jgi:hypothetical protein
MLCTECVKPELKLWSGEAKEFWAIIDRYIRREELEADWNTLDEVLQLALLHVNKP